MSYADLNLGSDHGIEQLQLRVRAAASGMCLQPGWEDLSISTARTKCYRTAVNDGFSQIDRLVADKMAGKASLATAILISAR